MPPADSKTQIQRLFNRLAPLYARRVLRSARPEARQDAEWINPQPRERVLDLACGPGTLALELARQGGRVFAVDFAPRMLLEARRAARARRGLDLYLCAADAERLPLAKGSVDLVACSYSFACFPAPQWVVEEMRRVTRPGGRIAVVEVVAASDAARGRVLNRLERLRTRASVRHLSLNDLLALFYQAGLQLVDGSVLRRRQWLDDWTALSDCGHSPLARRRLQKAVLRASARLDPDWRLSRQRGRWCFYHTVARLLWRK